MPKIFKNTIYFFLAITPFFYVILIFFKQFRLGDVVIPNIANSQLIISTESDSILRITYTEGSLYSYFLGTFLKSGSTYNTSELLGTFLNICYNLNSIGINYRFIIIPVFIFAYECLLYFMKLLFDLVTIIPRYISNWVGEKV